MAKNKKKLVVLSGAGVSAESGLKTFRDGDGLWENHSVYDVATPEAWLKNPELVLSFYKARWEQMKKVSPNAAHFALAELEENFDVQIVTQNIDDLHERAGSSKVLHLHGEINLCCSERNPYQALPLPNGRYINSDDYHEDGGKLRPFVVWFGESVPMLEPAIEMVQQADIMIIVGTSLQVYPAASLVHYLPPQAKTYVIDPNPILSSSEKLVIIQEKAVAGMQILKKSLEDEI